MIFAISSYLLTARIHKENEITKGGFTIYEPKLF